jgi:AcrR family transcriptional regulator
VVLSVNDARDQALDAAEELIYARGVHSVGMDDVRNRSGVSLKRLYVLFPRKEALVEAVLERRDQQWRQRLGDFVERVDDPDERLLAVFDWLAAWFAEPGFRGCAWINVFGELGATSPALLAQVRAHKDRFAAQLARWVSDAGRPPELAGQLLLLAEGAMVTAGIHGDPGAARTARRAAGALLGRA